MRNGFKLFISYSARKLLTPYRNYVSFRAIKAITPYLLDEEVDRTELSCKLLLPQPRSLI